MRILQYLIFAIICLPIQVIAAEVDTVYVKHAIPDTVIQEDAYFSFDISEVFCTNSSTHSIEYTIEAIDHEAHWLKDNLDFLLEGTPLQSDVGVSQIRVYTTGFENEVVADTFQITVVEVNDVPISTQKIGDQVLIEGSETLSISLLNMFFDEEDGSDLSLKVESTNESVIEAKISDQVLKLTPQNKGQSSITIIATDNGGAYAQNSFDIQVFGFSDIGGMTTLNTGSNGLLNNNTSHIYKDTNGQTFIATYHGISMLDDNGQWSSEIYDGRFASVELAWEENGSINFLKPGTIMQLTNGTFKSIDLREETDGTSNVMGATKTRNNSIWIAGMDEDFDRIRLITKVDESWLTVEDLPRQNVQHLENWGDSVVLALDEYIGIYYETEKVHSFSSAEINNEKVVSLAPISMDSLVIFTDQSVYIKNQEYTVNIFEDNFNDGTKFGDYLVGLSDRAVIVFDNKSKYKTIDLPKLRDGVNMRYLVPNSIFIDPDSSAWISSSQGAYFIDNILVTNPKITHYHTTDGLPSNEIWEIFNVGDTTWYMTGFGGTWSNNGVWNFLGEEIRPMMVSESGAVWCAKGSVFNIGASSIAIYDDGKWTTIPKKEIGLKYISDMAEDENGKVWVSGSGGLVCYDGKNWTKYTKEDGLLANDTYDVFFDSSRRLWITYEVYSSEVGLSVLNNNRWQHYEDQDFSGLHVTGFTEINDEVWISHWYGVIIVGKDNNISKITSYTHPLKTSEIQKIKQDPYGGIWFIYPVYDKLGVSLWTVKGEWFHFDHNSGIPDAIRNISFSLSFAEGGRKSEDNMRVILGSQGSGIHSISLDVLKQRSLISNAKLNEKTITLYPNPAHELLSLNLSGIQTLGLTISIIDLSGNVVMTNDHQSLSATHKLDLSNLSSGIYILQIQSSDIIESRKFIKH